jgi:hypothetical protein
MKSVVLFVLSVLLVVRVDAAIKGLLFIRDSASGKDYIARSCTEGQNYEVTFAEATIRPETAIAPPQGSITLDYHTVTNTNGIIAVDAGLHGGSGLRYLGDNGGSVGVFPNKNLAWDGVWVDQLHVLHHGNDLRVTGHLKGEQHPQLGTVYTFSYQPGQIGPAELCFTMFPPAPSPGRAHRLQIGQGSA